MLLGVPELLLVGGVIIIFFFGKDKVLDWAKTFGQAKREFSEVQKEVKGVNAK